ncbi:hypothetical protein OUZ56_001188 [Daphnia magna]|uniref:Uncharacterized protein n=1 Tax=Daphnia magna TaxID=35525 RepID=A0ABR0A1W5_9CRUS|nr:hypothetical protein OUZ56_001188 [Daphnia magna]
MYTSICTVYIGVSSSYWAALCPPSMSEPAEYEACQQLHIAVCSTERMDSQLKHNVGTEGKRKI